MAKMLTDLMGGELTVSSPPWQGATFRVTLFLPEVHGGLAVASQPAPAPRRSYLGARRHVRVVDNEETDRDLLVQLLEPLGFVLRTAASGHDCLDLLAAGYQPDVVFMDLAMPGIDGWETIRRLRQAGHTGIHVAIVSANAFDKTLENDVGIQPQDFIVKPLRHSELLDWLERRLALVWADPTPAASAPAPPVAPPAMPRVWPDTAALTALRELPAAALRGAPPGLQAPLRRTLRTGQRADRHRARRFAERAGDGDLLRIVQADPGGQARSADHADVPAGRIVSHAPVSPP